MTIALAVQVMDGLVLAADSAASINMGDGLSPNVYTNATKIVNLRRGLPLGIAFYGTGALGNASMVTLAKDLRQRFTGDRRYPEWRLDGNEWTVHGVAERVRQFFHDEHFACNGDASQVAGMVGIMVGGQSPDKHLSERYEITIAPDGQCQGPDREHDGTLAGIVPRGQPEAIVRLAWGMGMEIEFLVETTKQWERLELALSTPARRPLADRPRSRDLQARRLPMGAAQESPCRRARDREWVDRERRPRGWERRDGPDPRRASAHAGVCRRTRAIPA